MHRFLGAAFAAEKLVGAVGDHLVDVHVGLGAGTGLPHDQGEVLVEPAVDHFLRRLDDRLGATGVEQAKLPIGLGGGAFDDAERVDQRQRHAFGADAEIPPRALGLRAPIGVDRHVDGPNESVSMRVLAIATPAHFLRKRSRRTTSPPLDGLSGSFWSSGGVRSGLAEAASAPPQADGGRRHPGRAPAASSAPRALRRHHSRTAGRTAPRDRQAFDRRERHRQALGDAPNERPTSNVVSVTRRSQN